MDIVKTVLFSLWGIASVLYLILVVSKPKLYFAKVKARTNFTTFPDLFMETFFFVVGLFIAVDLVLRFLNGS